MKKRLLALLLALSLMLLSGCGESREDLPRVPEDAAPLEPYGEVCQIYSDFFFSMSPFIIGESLYEPEDIPTYRYESYAIFEGSEELAEQIMEDGKNPGLGVRGLHEQGITGEGVNVAVIDSPLFQDHPEYKDRIAAYYDSGCDPDDYGAMHGPTVLSILAGETLGVAPGAKVYFAATPSGKMDAAYFADCLYWIIEQNETLPEGEKIRVVSVSAGPEAWGDGEGFKNGLEWFLAVSAAKKAGILVIDCRSSETGFVQASYCPEGYSDDAHKYIPGYPGPDWDADYASDRWEKFIFAPASHRTAAQEYMEGNYLYTYFGTGAQSWAVPYVAGVLALGWQVNPDLDGQAMKDLLFESAYVNENGNHMIDPPAFIELVRGTLA